MPSTISILSNLKTDYPQFKFKPSHDFMWCPSDGLIYYDKSSTDLSVLLLHEVSHALLGHSDYICDIELITMERQAWDHALKLASKYNVVIDEEIIESTLDSYRNWLHSRSTCPKCNATGSQTTDTYSCSACNHKWRVNSAKQCALRRYS